MMSAADELAQGDVPDRQSTRDNMSPAQNYSGQLTVDTTTSGCVEERLRRMHQLQSPISGNTQGSPSVID